MREFTSEEKELITNTPITIECLDIDSRIVNCFALRSFLSYLESSRKELARNRNHRNFDAAFDILVHLLPNSYKVVELWL